MQLSVEPLAGPVDEAPRVVVEDVRPGRDVLLTIQTTDANGNRWRSRTELSGAAGTAESTGLADPSQPWWRMEFASEGVAPVAFAAPPDALAYDVTVESGSERLALTVSRQWCSQVERRAVSGEGYQLTSFTPLVGPGPWPGVVVVPGSTGAAAVEPMAALLASHGCAAAVLAYAGEPGLPPTVEAIPIEALAEGVRAFAAMPPVDGARLAVIASSAGTGGALSALATFEDLAPRCVVAIAPTSVVWQALGSGGPPPRASSWALGGEPLPWVPVHGEPSAQVIEHKLLERFPHHPTPRALHMHEAFAKGLSDEGAVAAAAIPVERIDAPLLLLTGEDDRLWPSASMARAILARRRRDDDRHLTYPAAGHFLRPPITPTTVPWTDTYVSGGEPAGNAAAQAQGWIAIRSFFDTHLA
ncbi:MAG: hypothetical protein GEV08_22560 [Acidimicrobiia bacterium]|nr:hypothetical protein [Acidimicrobiia bacterium]